MDKEIRKEIDQLENKMDELILERYELYQKVQDFSVSSNETNKISEGLKRKKREIVTAQNKLNQLKKAAGWSSDQIKNEDKRNLTRPKTTTTA